MAYVGNKPLAKYATLTRQTFSSPTGTSHTLSQTVTNSDDLLLYINNVKQNPADYTASGTTLTTASLAGGTEMYCLYYGKTTETVAPPASSVGDSHIVDMASSKLTGALPALDGSALTGLVTPKMKIVRSTYAFSALASASSATQTISGVGFAPDAIYGMWGVGNDTFKGPCFFWAINSSSSLAQSGTIDVANFHHNEKMTADSWRAINNALRWADGGSDYIGATITTWGSDGITITYTKTGSPTTSQTMNMETAYFKLT